MTPPRSAFAAAIAGLTLAGLVLLGATIAAEGASVDERIADAMSAGPAALAADATILGWPAEPGGEMVVLREGTNDWTCIESTPQALAAGLQDSSCNDEVWMGLFEAFMAGEEPTIDRAGFSYMLVGDAGAGNVDPTATGPEDDPTWHVSGPHIMILLPGSDYSGITTDYQYGGPYVMWADTPYAHIMVPIGEHEGPR